MNPAPPALLFALAFTAQAVVAQDRSPIDVGDRLEPFVDRYLIERLDGAELRLCEPRSAGEVLALDRTWEGILCGYFTVILDRGRYRMYYRGRPGPSRKDGTAEAREVTCYAESSDGIHWVRPSLGLFEIDGTRDNNVVLTGPPGVTHNFSPFVDRRPGAPADERYKAVGGLGRNGLFAFASADGIRWRPLRDEPILRDGAFDSQNVAFWSETEGCYVCYFRTWKHDHRWISRATSDDFRAWSAAVEMTFGHGEQLAPLEHLYTNQTQPYFRARHVYVATPARFWPGRRALSEAQAAELELDDPRNYGGLANGVSDAVFMTSRGGARFERTFLESFIRPGGDLRNWVARANYPALGVVPTGPREMSIYVQRHYGQPSAHVERLVLRTDGFASVRAGHAGGELSTRPLRFAKPGESATRNLVLNYATSAAGGIRVELIDAGGEPAPGFSLGDCRELIGDAIEETVEWAGGADVSQLAGRAIRIRFAMRDAELFSIRFR